MPDDKAAPAGAKATESIATTKSAIKTSGEVCVLACNLPHGLTIIHKGQNVTLAGANHPKAILAAVPFDTGARGSGAWGITRDIDAPWFEDWAKESQHPALASGNIMRTDDKRAEALVNEAGAEIKTGADPLDPEKPGDKLAPDKEAGKE